MKLTVEQQTKFKEIFSLVDNHKGDFSQYLNSESTEYTEQLQKEFNQIGKRLSQGVEVSETEGKFFAQMYEKFEDSYLGMHRDRNAIDKMMADSAALNGMGLPVTALTGNAATDKMEKYLNDQLAQIDGVLSSEFYDRAGDNEYNTEKFISHFSKLTDVNNKQVSYFDGKDNKEVSFTFDISHLAKMATAGLTDEQKEEIGFRDSLFGEYNLGEMHKEFARAHSQYLGKAMFSLGDNKEFEPDEVYEVTTEGNLLAAGNTISHMKWEIDDIKRRLKSGVLDEKIYSENMYALEKFVDIMADYLERESKYIDTMHRIVGDDAKNQPDKDHSFGHIYSLAEVSNAAYDELHYQDYKEKADNFKNDKIKINNERKALLDDLALGREQELENQILEKVQNYDDLKTELEVNIIDDNNKVFAALKSVNEREYNDVMKAIKDAQTILDGELNSKTALNLQNKLQIIQGFIELERDAILKTDPGVTDAYNEMDNALDLFIPACDNKKIIENSEKIAQQKAYEAQKKADFSKIWENALFSDENRNNAIDAKMSPDDITKLFANPHYDKIPVFLNALNAVQSTHSNSDEYNKLVEAFNGFSNVIDSTYGPEDLKWGHTLTGSEVKRYIGEVQTQIKEYVKYTKENKLSIFSDKSVRNRKLAVIDSLDKYMNELSAKIDAYDNKYKVQDEKAANQDLKDLETDMAKNAPQEKAPEEAKKEEPKKEEPKKAAPKRQVNTALKDGLYSKGFDYLGDIPTDENGKLIKSKPNAINKNIAGMALMSVSEYYLENKIKSPFLNAAATGIKKGRTGEADINRAVKMISKMQTFKETFKDMKTLEDVTNFWGDKDAIKRLGDAMEKEVEVIRENVRKEKEIKAKHSEKNMEVNNENKEVAPKQAEDNVMGI